MKGFDITIEEENHTLGFLLQTYLNKLNEGAFVGYMNPHPLEKKIKIRVNFNDDDINTVKEAFDKTTTYLVGELNKLHSTEGLKLKQVLIYNIIIIYLNICMNSRFTGFKGFLSFVP